MNLGLAYKTLKCYHGIDAYTYLYELPLKNWAVVQYEDDDETMWFSQFFFEWTDALHCFNKIRERKINEWEN